MSHAKEDVDIVISAPMALTMLGEDGIIDDACIAIEGDRIVYAGDMGGCHYDAEERIRLRHHVLMPGLIDAHAHTPLLAYRRMAGDLTITHEILTRALTVEMEGDLAYWSSLLAYFELLMSGVTTVLDSYMNAGTMIKASEKSGMRIIASELVSSRTYRDGVKKAEEMASEGFRTGLTVFSLDGFDVDELLSAMEGLHEKNVLMTIDPSGADPRLLHELESGGFWTPDVLVLNAHTLYDEVLERLTSSGVGFIYLPFHSIILTKSINNVKTMLYGGVRSAMGSGSRILFSTSSILDEARLASLELLLDGLHASPYHMLEMLTVNASRLLDLKTGVLAPGFKADIIALNLFKLNIRPLAVDIYSSVLYSATIGDFDYVIVDGKIVVEEGRHRWLYHEGIARKLERLLDETVI